LWLGSPVGTLWSTRLACCIDGVHRLDICFTHNYSKILTGYKPWVIHISQGALGGLISSLEGTSQNEVMKSTSTAVYSEVLIFLGTRGYNRPCLIYIANILD